MSSLSFIYMILNSMNPPPSFLILILPPSSIVFLAFRSTSDFMVLSISMFRSIINLTLPLVPLTLYSFNYLDSRNCPVIVRNLLVSVFNGSSRPCKNSGGNKLFIYSIIVALEDLSSVSVELRSR